MYNFALGAAVYAVRPEFPETIHHAVIAGLPDANDPAYTVDFPDRGRHRLRADHLATDLDAARAIQKAALVARADYFARKAARLQQAA